MSNTIHALGAAGPGVPLYASGQEWLFSMVGPGLRADFARWCRTQVQKRLEQFRAEYTAAEYQEQRRMLQDKVLCGHYSWGTPLEENKESQSSMGAGLMEMWHTTEGQIAFTQFLLKAKHGAVSAEQVAAIWEDNIDGFRDVLFECLWRYPNWPAPGWEALAQRLSLREAWTLFRTLKAKVQAAGASGEALWSQLPDSPEALTQLLQPTPQPTPGTTTTS